METINPTTAEIAAATAVAPTAFVFLAITTIVAATAAIFPAIAVATSLRPRLPVATEGGHATARFPPPLRGGSLLPKAGGLPSA
ncbi:hypothetical protein KSP39_PZI006517 [Platanthera zijinensis]|uniref:Uncharacterized protein n=1 Tax=Platanthera zijinensis TaxID=2320716 RepID=A0AAP0BT36_9ASPA